MPVYAFLIFYRVRPLSDADKKKATVEWDQFKKKLSKGIAIVGEYAHIWGTTYNGMIVGETRDLTAFHDFWHRFREQTRWYVPETSTYIAQKEEEHSHDYAFSRLGLGMQSTRPPWVH